MKNYSEWYGKLANYMMAHPALLLAMKVYNRFFPLVMGVTYALVLSLRVLGGSWRLLLADLLVPASGFLILSAFRAWLNHPRPYEQEPIQPLLAKETKGQSFPSRHVFSATILAMVLLHLSSSWGLLALFCAGLLALVRVLAGVHYPRDVLAGYLAGLLWGCLLWLF